MEKLIAYATSDMKDCLKLKSVTGPKYIVSFEEGLYRESDYYNERHEYTSIQRAWEMFKSLLAEHGLETVNLCQNFVSDYEEYLDPDYDSHYTPSATAGDYSPSNPWNAPGMSVHDFI